MATKNIMLIPLALAIALSGCASGKKEFVDTHTPRHQHNLVSVIRIASDHLNTKIPSGSPVAVVSAHQEFPALSEHIINHLIENAISDKVFSVVDRAQLDAIRREMTFQMSGEVNDDSVRSVGRMVGAKTIITVAVSYAGDSYLLGVRALDIESAGIQAQINLLLPSNPTVAALAAAAPPAATPQDTAAAAKVITVPGEDLVDKLSYIQKNMADNTTYIIELTQDEIIRSQSLETGRKINATIIIRGDSVPRTIRLRSHSAMFTVRSGITLVLDNNVILSGVQSKSSLVVVAGGTLIMNDGAVITDNIVDNAASQGGGGVEIPNPNGTFIMNGGKITNNTNVYGGGVFVAGGTFVMNGGEIIGNTAIAEGGGVSVGYAGTFTMNGGVITGNIAAKQGGGVWVLDSGILHKTGGTITGYENDHKNNRVINEQGEPINDSGHALWTVDKIFDTTVDPDVKFRNTRRVNN